MRDYGDFYFFDSASTMLLCRAIGIHCENSENICRCGGRFLDSFPALMVAYRLFFLVDTHRNSLV
ncbi:protein of unknown function [Candidatus Nitrospira inopinata]|uniref:Uncharacterized protein n=1 Tax=Candidatus Nitrospira inopinata TaxID=1715989 RepID=A0A0S4KW49_9BACT|nr:protein of unknown function [Candidatus Nitrospira inopinata]